MPICVMTSTARRAARVSTPYISSANFAAPTALSSITIQNIVGNYASFTVTRTGGGLANYTSPVQNFPVNSFTDPTVLTNNSQYTYTITPVGGIAFTAIVNPNNAGSPGKIYTLATVSGLNPVYSGASSNISSVYITWSNNGYTTLYLANTTKGGGNYTASGTAYNSTTNGSSDSNLTTNTQYTYTFSCRNGDGYYVANSACQTTVNTCTWASCNAPTFFNTYDTRTSLSCTGLFNRVYITYSGGTASPASGTTDTGTNSIGQDYTSMTNGVTYSFVCYPVNLLGYQSSNSASSLVTPSGSSGPYINIFTVSSVTNFQSGDISGNSSSNGIVYTVYSLNTVNVSYTVNYTATTSGVVQLFCIGGGGSGGAAIGAGGGAGGVIQTSVFLPAGSGAISVIVGDGGGPYTSTSAIVSYDGNNTTVTFNATSTNYIAYGGGGGGTRGDATTVHKGGCGGGSSTQSPSSAGSYPYPLGGAAQSSNAIAAGNIGYNGGGYGQPGKNQYGGCGGGGGAGGPGGNGSISSAAGVGGPGMKCTLSGIAAFSPFGTPYGNYYWAGGGAGTWGGATPANGGNPAGGIGGGGAANNGYANNGALGPQSGGGINPCPIPAAGYGQSGAPNTGGGGGGYYNNGGLGSKGGSGIVLIAFP